MKKNQKIIHGWGCNMNVRFIDTSIMCNLLEVPKMCDDKEEVKQEWKEVLERKETLIMPLATIIETGNHIAHIPDGNSRRAVSLRFKEFLEKTAESKAPWTLYGNALDSKEIKYIAENLDQFTLRGTGIGDMTIIYAYEKYLKEGPAIGTIMIWSKDGHLSTYRQENVCMQRRRKR